MRVRELLITEMIRLSLVMLSMCLTSCLRLPSIHALLMCPPKELTFKNETDDDTFVYAIPMQMAVASLK